MQTRTIAFVLIVVGIIFLSYSGFNYVTTEKIIDIGPIEVEAKKNNFVSLSPIIGVVLLLGGLYFLSRSKK